MGGFTGAIFANLWGSFLNFKPFSAFVSAFNFQNPCGRVYRNQFLQTFGVFFCFLTHFSFRFSISNPFRVVFFIHPFSVMLFWDSIFKSVAGPGRFFSFQFSNSCVQVFQALVSGFNFKPLRLRVVFQLWFSGFNFQICIIVSQQQQQ